ncbi:hypothetical protein LIG30_3460 [Burkholderia sp. lig30]|uniref:hypothetical protein n=1 Tax=Burkholderia sp. lig30 TaxID=1192124 RepID=UPI000461B91B|nr:hypothetical protein [Burkholderia sp. lig30]KDB07214.1 hypothetical protein LIG30_3460 [Burkholderia sp. lig30]
MRRASAIGYLLARRRQLVEKMDAGMRGDAEFNGNKEIARLDRLVLDVRAGRIRAFRLDEPESIEIIVTTD